MLTQNFVLIKIKVKHHLCQRFIYLNKVAEVFAWPGEGADNLI